MPKLKLFRTTSGFHDSYVAATSRAAALKAWGARTDLFAMGAAEQVDDPAIMKEASKAPGTIYQKKRPGLGQAESAKPHRKKPRTDPRKAQRALQTAERNLADAERARISDLRKLDAEIDRLTRQRSRSADRHERSIERLREAAEKARALL